MKTHLAVNYTRFGEAATRSLCGRSSGRVWSVETVENRQNVGAAETVTCSFCLRRMAARTKRAETTS